MSPPANRLRPAPRAALVRYWLTRTFSGRAIIFGAVAKITAVVLTLAIGRSTWTEAIDTLGDLALIGGALIVGYRLFVDIKQRSLWRVREKLTLSYIFMGFVPALLIIVFFLVALLLVAFNIASYMLRTELAQLVEQVRFVAESAALGIEHARTAPEIQEALQVRQSSLALRYPDASIALVPTQRTCGAPTVLPGAIPASTVGPWRHLPPPAAVPRWIICSGHADLITFTASGDRRIAARAVAWAKGSDRAVIVDVPIDAAFNRQLLDRVGLTLEGIRKYDPVALEAEILESDGPGGPPKAIIIGPANIGMGDGSRGLQWIAAEDYAEWEDGAKGNLLVSFRMSLWDIYDRVARTAPIGEVDLARLLIWFLVLVGVLFLIIQVVAFSMGLALARSITGAVHELFAGTERVRRGDFGGRVRVRSRDQLGELSESFNSMTASIEDLLHQKAEKERLEQELRIARNIQMSLLPQGPLAMPGVTLTAHCEPAREVGGDYYDFLPIDEHTLGVLVADVSGKGTSAALYMAELKGIVLSLSQRHRSPRDLLIEADGIISRHLDSRSFITVTYLVVDLRSGTLQYARAGHCPLVYVPGPYATAREPQLLAPDGLVLGLQLDGGRTFVRLLEEVTVPLGRGDLFVLFTDGITEAMNADGECYGEARLASLIGQHADLGADELRERILRDIDAFTASAVQQDDMTMVLLRIEQVGQARLEAAMAHADA